MLNFALIGCGRIGNRHAALIRQFGTLKAVCDVIRERAEVLAGSPGVGVYTDIETLLENEKDLSVVVICTPNGLHAPQSILSLKAGCHVLCEKPMALTVADCKSMMAAARENNRHLVIVKQNRYNPPVEALKKIIGEGRLGRVIGVQVNCFWNRNPDYYKDSWRGTLELDGGTLFTQFSHFIDLLPWLVGEVKEVQAVTANQIHKNLIEFEDCGVVNMVFENGAIGSLHYTVNSYGKNMEGSITVFGEKGTVKVGGEYLNKLEYRNIDNFKFPELAESNPPNQYGGYSGSMSNHHRVYENLMAVLANKEAIMAGGEDGLKTVNIIEHIYASARKL